MITVREKIIPQQNLLPTSAVKSADAVNGEVTTVYTYHQKVVIYKTYQIIWYILGVIEALLAFRFILKLIAANPLNLFATFVYNFSHPLAYPFFGLVINPTAPNGFVFEWSTMIGMLVYAAVTYGVIYLLQLVIPVPLREVDTALDNVK